MRYLRLILESSDNIIPFEGYTLRCVGKTLYINPITDTHAYMIDYPTEEDASDEMYGITEWLNDDESPTVYEINRTDYIAKARVIYGEE